MASPRETVKAKIQELLELPGPTGTPVVDFFPRFARRIKGKVRGIEDPEVVKLFTRFSEGLKFVNTLSQDDVQAQFFERSDDEAHPRQKMIDTLRVMGILLGRESAPRGKQDITVTQSVREVQETVRQDSSFSDSLRQAYGVLQDICDACEPKILIPAELRMDPPGEGRRRP
jgi:hypothetical protein